MKSALQKILLPLILFAFLTFIVHPTLFTGFSTEIETNDGRLLAWTLSWNAHKLLTDPLGIFEANIYYPNHNTLTYSEHLIGASYISVPAFLIFQGNPIAIFNLLMILSYVLNAFFAYWLAKYLTKNYYAALIAGLIFGFCTYKIVNIAHLQNMIIFYIPLMMFFVLKYLDTKKLKYIALTGLMLLLQSLTSWYHMVFIFLLFFLLFAYYVYKKSVTKQDLIRFGGMLFAVGLLILPFAIPYFIFNKESASAYSINEVKLYSADLGGYLFPAPDTFLNKVVSFLRITKTSWMENQNYIGYVSLILMLIALFKVKISKWRVEFELKKGRLKYFLIGLVFVIFSFGPFLRIDDISTKIPLPYYLVYTILTPIRFIRAVARFATVFFLLLSILGSFGFLDLIKNKSRRFAGVAFVIVFGLIFLDYLPVENQFNRYTDVSKTPAVYEYIRDSEDVKAIVELPINVDPFVTSGYVYYAGIHFKPLLNGYSGYEPKNYSFYKDILTSHINTIGYSEMQKIGLTHILINPDYKVDLDLSVYELVYSADGYELYKLQKQESDFVFFYDNFESEISEGFPPVEYTLYGTNINQAVDGTPFANVSPGFTDEATNFNITTLGEFSTIELTFRAYSESDYVTIVCGNYVKTFSKTSKYIDTPLTVDCGIKTNNAQITMFSTEFVDRALVKDILLK